MGTVKTRIGFILASIHTGSAQNVWSNFARESKKGDFTLFIFPSGRLNYQPDSEYLRNSLFSLVNPCNLDGVLSWSSTIGYTVNNEEFNQFHERFALPYVTIAYKVPGAPCVMFNAYRGMKELVTHFIKEHGAKKIAFLRGPATHSSAEDRFKGYCDALKEAKIRLDENLISEPCSWNNGEAAAVQLFESRKLRPGEHFDTLIGASDMMIFSAINYFQRQGFSVPEDYRAGGFNNSVESKILENPISTVRMPYTEMSGESFKILKTLLNKANPDSRAKSDKSTTEDSALSLEENFNIPDIQLPSELIIRNSCGCRKAAAASQSVDNTAPAISGDEACASIIELISSRLRLDAEGKDSFIVPMIQALFQDDASKEDESNDAPSGNIDISIFCDIFSKSVQKFFDTGGDIDVLIEIIDTIWKSGFLSSEKIRSIEPAMFRIISQAQERMHINGYFQTEQRHVVLNSLKCEFLGTRDRQSLIRSLARHLPKIGIDTASVMLYGDEKASVCIGSFSPNGIAIQEQRFLAEQMFPLNIKDQYEDGIYMVQPLFIENQSLGYFVHNVPFYDGVILEDLRSSVSNALKGIFLFEEANRAKQIAEQAERTKNEFFVTVGNDLYDPLAEIMDKIEQLEKNLPLLNSEPDIIAEQITFLKACVASRQEDTNRLIDLTLSQLDELSFNSTLFNIDTLLPGSGTFPLLSGDVNRLSQAFSLIEEECGSRESVKMQRYGLEISFRNPKLLPPEIWTKHTLLLAERIILMHNGQFQREVSGCTIILPWITLSGEKAEYSGGGQNDMILSLSDTDLLPSGFFDLPIIQDIDKAIAIPGRIACIVWNADSALMDDYVRVSALHAHPEFFHVPFLCYSRNLSGEILIASVDAVIQTPKKGKVLFIGVSSGLFPAWADDDLAINIASVTDFTDIAASITPDLIVMDSIDIDAIGIIRRHPLTVMIPIIAVPEKIDSSDDVMNLSQFSRIILCNRAVAASQEFSVRVKAIITGDEILPPHTGSLVKKAILYFNQSAESHISRWKLADAVNVSEDYLTRIFHREMGFPLWEYLNRYRVCLATELLIHTNDTIYEIAMKTGFQDQAYFCRVFKKICGIPPGQLRKK
jgi:DNA-binding LacI/PurR family transcriptional regulator/AraC-like DNA-binding protein